MSNKAGFYDSPSKTFSPNATNSPSQDGGSKKRNQPLIPVTIKQLLEAKQLAPDADDFTLNNQSLGQVSVVAQIIRSSTLATNLNYQIDDATGTIDVRVWIDTEGTDYAHHKCHEWTQGSYVRVVGSLRAFNGKRSIVAVRLMTIDDFNELTCHFLEIIHLTLSLNGPRKNTSKSSGQSYNNNNNNNNNNAYTKPQTSNSGNTLNELQNEIIQLVVSNQGDDMAGVNIQEIIATYTDIADEETTRKAVQFLIDEGHLFTTTSDDMVAATGDY
jgi:replication factor A2